jgi:L-asparagine oxygenase
MRPFVSRLAAKTKTLSDPTRVITALWNQNRRDFGSIVTTRISDVDKQKFINFAEGRSEDPYKEYTLVQEQTSEILRGIIPRDTREILEDFGRKGLSLVVLQNSPVIGSKGLPPTPTSSKKPENKDFVSEFWMLGLSGLVGAKPFITDNVRDGSVINQLIPLEPKSISGSGSRLAFDFHNEIVHEPHTPDFFLLLCLRGNPFAKTQFCFVEDIIRSLPVEIVEELQKPNFLFKSGDKSVFKEAKEFRSPILTRDEMGNFEIRLNLAPNRCEGLTDGAKFALAYTSKCIRDNTPVHSIALSHGDTALISDRKLLHSRTAFDENQKTTAEDDKRWMQRMNLDRNKSSQPIIRS